ncbi:MAG: hypothetical protein RL135_1279, partial [Bacteroidota bacterium]
IFGFLKLKMAGGGLRLPILKVDYQSKTNTVVYFTLYFVTLQTYSGSGSKKKCSCLQRKGYYLLPLKCLRIWN